MGRMEPSRGVEVRMMRDRSSSDPLLVLTSHPAGAEGSLELPPGGLHGAAWGRPAAWLCWGRPRGRGLRREKS